VQVRGPGQQVGHPGAQLAAGGRGAPRRPAAAGRGQPRDGQPGHQQPGGQHRAGRGQDDQAHAGRGRADQEGGQRRRGAADEQVLGGVDVADQPGQQVPGPELAQSGRGQPLQPLIDAHPHVGQHPEGRVV